MYSQFMMHGQKNIKSRKYTQCFVTFVRLCTEFKFIKFEIHFFGCGW